MMTVVATEVEREVEGEIIGVVTETTPKVEWVEEEEEIEKAGMVSEEEGACQK